MSDDIKPEVIKKTQDILSKFIKKPQLTEKLLKKPPFRFLHDIVSNVIKETGFLQGLFTEEELNHENIKDREGKIAFLDKLINCVKLATGSQLTVRSTKIVAGLEPTRTNELLQAIGQALAKKVNSLQAVQEVLKKSSKKPSTGESRQKDKLSEAGAAPKQESSRRDKRDPSTSREAKAEKKDPSSSVKGVPRGQDRKSDKQEGAGDAKKKSSSNQKPVKEKEAVKTTSKSGKPPSDDLVEKPSKSGKPTSDDLVKKPSKSGKPTSDDRVEKPSKSGKPTSDDLVEKPSKPGKLTSDDLVEIPRVRSSKIKDETENKVDEPVPDSKDDLVRRGSDGDKNDTQNNEPAPVQENSTIKLPDLTEKPAVVQEQNFDERSSSAKQSADEVVKVTTEKQRPVSALGRKRSAALSASKQQRSSEEQVEPKPAALSNEPKDKPTATKPDIPAPIPRSPARPPSSLPGTSRGSSDNQLSTATPIPLVRPRTAARQGSARPGAPRVKNRGEVALVSEEQVKSAAVNLIVEAEGAKVDQDEDENLVVLENTNTEPETTDFPRPDSGTRPSSGQGHLVAQILETQKELETRSNVVGVATSHAENSGPRVQIDWEASRQRERGTALRDVQRLCESIQTVTRAAHPIGKLLDSLQEDVDSMQQELENWQSMQRSLEEQLRAEEALSEQSTQPLKEHLQQLQQAVLAQYEQLRVSKANILANDQRIRKLLVGGDSMQHSIFSR